MCSAKKVKQVANIAAAVVAPVALLANVGTYGAGKGAVQGGSNGGGIKGALTGAVGGLQEGFTDPSGTITGKPTNAAPAPTPDESTPTTTPEPPSGPGAPAPGVSNLSEQRRKRRLAALRMGILGNIQAGNDTSSANLLTPTAGAGGGGKTLLGQ